MRALVLDNGTRVTHNYPQPGHPNLQEGEALVRIIKAGVCGTDLALVQGYAGFKGVLGHEFVGVVEQCQEDPAWVGRRVVGEINATCGTCANCRAGRPTHCTDRTVLGIRGRDGAFADYVTLPTENLHAVPDRVSDDQAVFAEPLAAALAITDQVHVRPTERVVLVGDGRLGQLIAQVLALTGCDLTVLGRHSEKLELLRARGIDVMRVARGADAPPITADVVIEATGSAAGVGTAHALVRPRGRLVLKSTFPSLAQVDLSQIVVDEVTVIGSRCGPFPPALRLLERGWVEVEPLVQARYPLAEGVSALARAGQRGMLKVLIEM